MAFDTMNKEIRKVRIIKSGEEGTGDLICQDKNKPEFFGVNVNIERGLRPLRFYHFSELEEINE